MLSTDTSISLILGIGGLLVSVVGTIVGYLSYTQMKACSHERKKSLKQH